MSLSVEPTKSHKHSSVAIRTVSVMIFIMSEEPSTSMEAMAQDDVSAGNNYFREKGSWTKAMELDSRHPIRHLIPLVVNGTDDEEFGDELTDSQWKLVLDRLGPTLRLHGAQQEGQDESERREDEDNDQDESERMEDEDNAPRTLDQKMAALGTAVNANGRADFDNNLSPEEKEHVAALKWATEVIRKTTSWSHGCGRSSALASPRTSKLKNTLEREK